MTVTLKVAGLRMLLQLAGILPTWLFYAVADLAAAAAWLASARIRSVTRDHMDHVPILVGDPAARDRAAWGCLRSAARYWADLARTAHLEPVRAFDEYRSFKGFDRLFAAVDRGCGVILVTAHLGAPEFAVRAASHLGLDILGLTERNPSPEFNALLHQARRRHGARFLEADFVGLRQALHHLHQGGILALIADRDITGTGRSVPFFGERTTLPTGPIDLALRTGAAVLPCWVRREAVARYSIEFAPPLALGRTGDYRADRERGLLALARALEAGIAAAPDQWFALTPIWHGLGAPSALAAGDH